MRTLYLLRHCEPELPADWRALDADGSYAVSEGDLTGTWHEYDGAVYLYGNAEIMFGVENGRLIYLRTDASPFPRAKVPDRATFTRLGGGM